MDMKNLFFALAIALPAICYGQAETSHTIKTGGGTYTNMQIHQLNDGAAIIKDDAGKSYTVRLKAIKEIDGISGKDLMLRLRSSKYPVIPGTEKAYQKLAAHRLQQGGFHLLASGLLMIAGGAIAGAGAYNNIQELMYAGGAVSTIGFVFFLTGGANLAAGGNTLSKLSRK